MGLARLSPGDNDFSSPVGTFLLSGVVGWLFFGRYRSAGDVEREESSGVTGCKELSFLFSEAKRVLRRWLVTSRDSASPFCPAREVVLLQGVASIASGLERIRAGGCRE